MDGPRSRGWEEALEASDARLSAIIDSAMDAILSVDEDQQIVVFNRAAEQMFRLPRSEALGEPLDRFIPARFRQAHQEHVRTFGDTGVTSRAMGHVNVLSAVRADGEEFPIEATISQVMAAGQKVFTVLIRDVTERVRLETRLRFLAEAGTLLARSLDFEETLSSVAMLVVPTLADWCSLHVLEEDGSVRLAAVAHSDPEKVKLAWELRTRYPADPEAPRGVPQVLRTGVSELYPEVGDAMLQAAARDEQHLQILREAGITSAIVVPVKSRERIRGALSLFAAESGRRFGPDDLALAEEVGRRASLALENAGLYRELQEADRRKDQFLAMLAHELRNPLSAISNALQVLRRSPAGDPRAGRAQDIIERQVHHQVRLVDDLLDVTRIARNRMELDREILDLAGLIRHTAEDHRRDVERAGHRLEVEAPETPVPVEADATRISQVLGNLLHNASKFTDPGGVIRVTVEPVAERGEVGVHVADTGIGVPADLLPNLFDAFAQAEQSLERARGGLGLGLALVRGLVELHGGRVEVRSGAESGSVFTFWLPCSAARVAADPVLEPSAPQAARRILVVEDNSGVAESLRDLLDVMGHQVQVADNGLDGVEAALAARPDMILCDLGLPGVDGYEVARRLKADPGTRDILLVALTGYGQEEDRRRSAEAGFDVHLTKPLRPQELAELLARSRPLERRS